MGHDDTAQEEKEIHRQIGLWQERLASKNYSAVKNGNGERGDSPANRPIPESAAAFLSRIPKRCPRQAPLTERIALFDCCVHQ